MDPDPVPRAVRGGLTQVDRLIARTLAAKDSFLKSLAGYLTDTNGKRVRPALVFLTARYLGRPSKHTPNLAAAVEMLHAATLVHDDILDNAPIRRHQKTLNFRWGNETSVLMGDLVFAAAFRLMTDDLPRNLLRIIADTAATVCRGQILETRRRYDPRLTEDDYLRIIGDKTASLLAACCETSALAAGAGPSVTPVLRRFGYLLGLAYQIVDDLLDYVGHPARIGKPTFSDLKEGRVTLPVIHCMRRATRSERRVLESALGNARKGTFHPARVMGLLRRHGSIEYARMRAGSYAADAQSALLLNGRSRNPEELLAYSEYLIHRDR